MAKQFKQHLQLAGELTVNHHGIESIRKETETGA
jgi:hypothetical protein